MSLFGKILEKLGFKEPEKPAPAAAKAATPAAPPVISAPVAPEAAPAGVAPAPAKPAAPAEPAPKPIAAVDVVAQLEKMAKANPQKLNWKTSIVDLLKLLGLDSSFAARKELAEELKCPAEKMKDSAQMNMWLHKTVLKKLAENGGNIPKDLLD